MKLEIQLADDLLQLVERFDQGGWIERSMLTRERCVILFTPLGFFFKRTTNGNLIGEWSNYEDAHIYAEGADVKLPGNENYNGYYFSTWQENGVTQLQNWKSNGMEARFQWFGGKLQ